VRIGRGCSQAAVVTAPLPESRECRKDEAVRQRDEIRDEMLGLVIKCERKRVRA
jgi:hypothetical protein